MTNYDYGKTSDPNSPLSEIADQVLELEHLRKELEKATRMLKSSLPYVEDRVALLERSPDPRLTIPLEEAQHLAKYIKKFVGS